MRLFLAALAVPAALMGAAHAATITHLDRAPEGLERLERLDLAISDFRLDGPFGTGFTVQGDVTTPLQLIQPIVGREGLDGGSYINNNDAETMTWMTPPDVAQLWVRITDANDQPGQGGTVSWFIETGDSASALGPRLPSGNVQWYRFDDFFGAPITMRTGITHDGYSVEGYVPIGTTPPGTVPAVPLPASGLLLFCGLGLIALGQLTFTRRRFRRAGVRHAFGG